MQKGTVKRQMAPRWKVAPLALGVAWLALAACSGVRSLPTLVPTLTYAPTPSITPSPIPTAVRPTETPFAPGFPVSRTATLENNQSFDFRQESVGGPTEGDLYYVAFSPRQGSACFWANNGKQVGGRDLGSWPLTALTERPLPRDRYSGQCVPVIRRHVYVYGIIGDERLAVLRVVDTGPTWVTFEYILRQ